MSKDLRFGMMSSLGGFDDHYSPLDFQEAVDKIQQQIQLAGEKSPCWLIYATSIWHGQGQIPLEAIEPTCYFEAPANLYPSEGAYETTLEEAYQLLKSLA